MKRVRFWEFYHTSWVRITLKQGQSLSCGYSRPDEEGYNFAATRWTLEGDEVIREWSHGGRDCDGYISTTGTDRCPVAELGAVEAYPDTDHASYFNDRLIHRPNWQEYEPSRVNDQYAQLANY